MPDGRQQTHAASRRAQRVPGAREGQPGSQRVPAASLGRSAGPVPSSGLEALPGSRWETRSRHPFCRCGGQGGSRGSDKSGRAAGASRGRRGWEPQNKPHSRSRKESFNTWRLAPNTVHTNQPKGGDSQTAITDQEMQTATQWGVTATKRTGGLTCCNVGEPEGIALREPEPSEARTAGGCIQMKGGAGGSRTDGSRWPGAEGRVQSDCLTGVQGRIELDRSGGCTAERVY